MKSNVKEFAVEKNLKTPQDLSHELKVSWTTAKQLWDGDIGKMRIETISKAASFFDCKIDDLLQMQSGDL
jgi:DNA-binding Xre family transcriptional regulator